MSDPRPSEHQDDYPKFPALVAQFGQEFTELRDDAPTVDHAREARRHIEWAHAQQEAEGEYDHSVGDNATLAVAEATLALVEQQRDANYLLGRIFDHMQSTRVVGL